MTRAASVFARSERRLNLRSRVLISFAAAAVFLLSANIFLAVLLNNDVNTNLDRTLAQSALPILGQANHSRATLLSQVGILALYDVVVVTAKSSAGTTTRISVGPPAGLAELQDLGVKRQ